MWQQWATKGYKEKLTPYSSSSSSSSSSPASSPSTPSSSSSPSLRFRLSWPHSGFLPCSYHHTHASAIESIGLTASNVEDSGITIPASPFYSIKSGYSKSQNKAIKQKPGRGMENNGRENAQRDWLSSQAAVVPYFVFLPTLVSHFFMCVHLPTNTIQLVVNF